MVLSSSECDFFSMYCFSQKPGLYFRTTCGLTYSSPSSLSSRITRMKRRFGGAPGELFGDVRGDVPGDWRGDWRGDLTLLSDLLRNSLLSSDILVPCPMW